MTTMQMTDLGQCVLPPGAALPDVPGVVVVWSQDGRRVCFTVVAFGEPGLTNGKIASERKFAARAGQPVTFVPLTRPELLARITADPLSPATEPAATDTAPPGSAPAGPVIVACDGSSLNNPGCAGWSWYVDPKRWAADGVAEATNNAMELTAVIEFLTATAGVLDDVETVIRCDSKYVIDGATKWRRGWERNNWRNSKGEPVKNLELWRRMFALLDTRTATRFEWVKGHAGDALNTAADLRANGAATAVQTRTTINVGPGWAR